MAMILRRWVAFAMVVCTTISNCGCTGKGVPDDYEPLAELVKNAERLTLYEGLPHQDAERELFEKELAEKPTIKIGEYDFYAKELPLTPSEVAGLREIFQTKKAFAKYSGDKKCGGFHPDYCAEWYSGEARVKILICLGCSEAKIHGPSRTLHFELTSSGYAQLKASLNHRWQSRPRSELTKILRPE